MELPIRGIFTNNSLIINTPLYFSFSLHQQSHEGDQQGANLSSYVKDTPFHDRPTRTVRLQNSLQDQTTQTETIEDFTINSNTLTEKSSENRISYSENTTQTDPISFLHEEKSSETVVLTQKSEKIVRTTCCSNNISCNGSSNIKDSVTQDYSDIGYQSDISDFSSPFPNKQIQSLH